MMLWIAGCAVIALPLYVGVTFNELVAERNQVRAAWALRSSILAVIPAKAGIHFALNDKNKISIDSRFRDDR